MNTVIFACIHNAGRSQMAAAWFDALADSTKARAISAGTEPGTHVHPEVLEAMLEAAGRVCRFGDGQLPHSATQGGYPAPPFACAIHSWAPKDR